MDLFLGVDAGGSRTRAVLANVSGTVLGVGAAGAANWQALGAAAAGEALRAAVAAAFLSAEVGAGAGPTRRPEAAELRGSFFGLAGVRGADERALMAEELAALGLAGPLEVAGDLVVAQAGALAAGPGVVVIAGTGSAAWGKNAAGETAQAGGWGWLVDDKGGGYWLALRGLAAAVEAEDGRGEASSLGARASAFFGVAGLRELLRELHAGRRDRTAVAAFAREVCAAAAAGDGVAGRLMGEAAEELLRLAVAVRGRLATGPLAAAPADDVFPLAMSGGLGAALEPLVARRAEEWGLVYRRAWGEPVLGAVLLAAKSGGAELDAEARARLLATWTPRAV